MMQLRELDADGVTLASEWLADERNARWLDFGGDVQRLSAVSLRMMTQRGIHCLRLFTADASDEPIGIVGLSDVGKVFRTARLWYVLGDKRCAGRGCASRAVRQMLDHGFGPLELESINAWAVRENAPSIRVLEKNHFRPIGVQRRCHWLDGRHADRLLFDLLSTEHMRSP